MSVEDLNAFVAAVAARIIEFARREDFQPGHHLTEQSLAESLGVSRSPVRKALRHLEGLGMVQSEPNRGFFLKKTGATLRRLASKLPAPTSEASEENYLRIADDRLSGALAEEVSESGLMTRYELTRGQVQRVLHRMAREGMVERKHGRGWIFKPMLTTAAAHDQSYRLRMIIEPAAILEPTFRLDTSAIERCKREQHEMLDGGIMKLSRSDLFRVGANFHETIISFSGNRFLVDALRSQNQLRRVMEYRANFDRARLIRQCEEHLRLIDMLERGARDEAAAFLKQHLDVVRDIKIAKDAEREAAEVPARRVQINF